ncbi:MAG TPA: hypothetical protein PKD79_04190 [Candidatus Doudnabacteria bacterium]|nr:hypothetical protein [Candidatus Doudnabacteria bacterium]
MNQNNSVHFLIVIAIGATTATYAYFVRYLTESKWLAMIVFIGFGTMVYLTIFSTIYAENLTRGIGGHLIGYLIVYLSRFLYLELNEKVENPRPNMIRD